MTQRENSTAVNNLPIDEEAIALHLSILGSRPYFCLVGGKYEWNGMRKPAYIIMGQGIILRGLGGGAVAILQEWSME
jgi:hypothetical protein